MTSKTSDFARYNRASQVGAPLISRKDTIIIAMLVNIALLVVLFATASKRHEVALAAKTADIAQVSSPIDRVADKSVSKSSSKTAVKTASKLPVDEIDELLAELATNSAAPAKTASATTKSSAKSTNNTSSSSVASAKQDSQPEYYVIKSGDNPWTIARKFHIKFEDLLRLNNLDEEKAKNLKIGQKLRIR
jgi:LysM repeat protein